jgi:hypothetical protein
MPAQILAQILTFLMTTLSEIALNFGQRHEWVSDVKVHPRKRKRLPLEESSAAP